MKHVQCSLLEIHLETGPFVSSERLILSFIILISGLHCDCFAQVSDVASHKWLILQSVIFMSGLRCTLNDTLSFSCSGNADICELLVQYGAQINATQKNGASSLMHAADQVG